MKICFFTDINALGGGELWALNAGHQLQKMGHEVAIVCPWRSPLQEKCLAQGIEVFSYLRMEGVPVYEPIYHFLKRRAFDVLYCTVIGAFCEANVLETLVNRINESRPRSKMILILKTGLPPMAGLRIEHYGICSGPAVPRLHVVSEFNRLAFLDWFRKTGADCDDDYVEVVREGVRLDRFRVGATVDGAAAGWGIPEDRPIILCLARLHVMKGQDNLLLAFPDVLRKHPDALLLMAGAGEDRGRLERLRDHLGLRDNVRFLGHVEDVPALLSFTDVLCHPSLNDGVPNSIVEAMAMAVPVVASAVGGIPEIVSHEKNGLLIPPHDVRGIGKMLNRLLQRPRLRQQYGERGRLAVRERFDLIENTHYLVRRLRVELDHVQSAYARERNGGRRTPVPALFLMNALRTGGEETELRILARRLDRTRFRLSVHSSMSVDEDAPALQELAANGVPVDRACHGQPLEKQVRYLVEKIRREGIRVMVACQDPSLAYQVRKQLLPNECHLIEHGGVVEEASVIPKDLTKRYIGVSEAIRQAAADLMERPDHALLIPSMVDTDEFARLDRNSLRKAYGFQRETTVVTFVGRLDPKKRVENLLKAAATLLPGHPNLLFLIVGGADAFQMDYAALLMEASQQLIATKRVVFTGSRGDVPRLLAASDILVQPGVGEGMSHVVNEAGAAGLAVIATDDGAASEQLDGGEGGRIVPVDDPKRLCAELQALILDPAARRRLGEHLKAKVEAEYSARVLVPRWESVLSEVCTTPQARPQTWDAELQFPSEIQIQTTSLCNASCIMCPYPQVSQEIEHGRMTDELYERILKECSRESRLRRIEPFLMNEPFTDKQIIQRIARAKQMVPHALVTLTTNGVSLSPRVAERLVRSGLDAIWFSFNGASPATYEKIMGISYDTVRRNIDYLLTIRPPSLQVFVNMVETEPMAPEIEENVRYWESLGVTAGTSPLVNRAGNVENFEDLRYMPMSDKPIRTCELPFYKMYIMRNGDAVLCCMDWRSRVVIGNVAQQSIREIWNGPEYTRLRRKHIEGREGEVELCSRCSYTLS